MLNVASPAEMLDVLGAVIPRVLVPVVPYLRGLPAACTHAEAGIDLSGPGAASRITRSVALACRMPTFRGKSPALLPERLQSASVRTEATTSPFFVRQLVAATSRPVVEEMAHFADFRLGKRGLVPFAARRLACPASFVERFASALPMRMALASLSG